MKKNDLIEAVNSILIPQGKMVSACKPIVGKNLVDGVDADKIYFAESISAKGFGESPSVLELRHGSVTDLTDFERVVSDELNDIEKEYTNKLFNSLVCENVDAYFTGWEFTFTAITAE